VFSSFPFEGILGLGFPSLSFGGIKPFFDRVIEQKLLNHNEFAFFLNADSTSPSAILWGGVDKDLYVPPIRMFPIAQAHYWALELVDFKLGGRSLAGKVGSHGHVRRLIIDSGTTYFTAPSEIYSEILAQVPEADCDMAHGYEPITYVLRDTLGKTFDLEVTHETYMISDKEGLFCRPAFMELDLKARYGPAMILGEVFMRHFFTVFSRGDGSPGQAKVGIAKARTGVHPRVSEGKPSFLQHEASPLMRHEVPWNR